jgi:hypothetical protein
MCGDNHYAKAAEQRAVDQEAQRRSQIAGTEKALAGVYEGPQRQAQYQDFLAALRQNYSTDLNRQKTVATRGQKFGLARAGLTGGSTAVDAKRQLGEDFATGTLNAENKAQAALGNLRSTDEATRNNLFQLGVQGADATTTASRAASSGQSSLGVARDQALGNGLGDVFANSLKVQEAQRQAAVKRAEIAASGINPYQSRI